MRCTTSILVVVCLALGDHARAGSVCLPADCVGKAYQSDQQGIIFYHKTREELVIRVDYEVRDAIGPITRLGWIIPLPGRPDALEAVSTETFAELADFTVPKYVSGDREPAARGGELPEPLPRNAPVIELIKGSGKGGFDALDAWLRAHGLQAISPQAARYYTERRWFFVAVLFEDPEGLPMRGRLTPVRASFIARQIVFPLRLCADEGVFDVTLYVLSKGSINRRELAQFGLTLAELESPETKQSHRITRVRDLPDRPAQLFDSIARTSPVAAKLESGRIFLYRVYGHGLNDEDRPIAGWATDLELSPPVGSPLSPYINVTVAVAAVLAVFVVARTRQRMKAQQAR